MCGEKQSDLYQNEKPNKKSKSQLRNSGRMYAENAPIRSNMFPSPDSIPKHEVEQFIDQFFVNIEANDRALKNIIQQIQGQNKNVNIDVNSQVFCFPSISNIYRKLQIDNHSIIHQNYLQKLLEPYYLSCQFMKQNKSIIMNMQYLLKALEYVIIHGFRQEDGEFQKRKQSFVYSQKVLLDMVEKLIELSKDSSKRERSRILVEEFKDSGAFSENERMRENIEKMQERIEHLEKQKDFFQNETRFYENVTIPRLKEELTKLKESFIQLTSKDEFKPQETSMKLQDPYKIIEHNQGRIDERQARYQYSQGPSMSNFAHSNLKDHSKQLKKQDEMFDTSTSDGFKAQIQLLNNILKDKERKNQFLYNKINQINEENRKLFQECQRSKTERQNIETENAKLKISVISLQKQRGQPEKEEQKPLKNNKQLEEDNSKRIEQNKQKDLLISQLNKKISQISAKLESANNRYLQLQLLFTNQSSELKEAKQLNKELAVTLDELKSNTRVRSMSFVEHKTLFSGDLLESKKKEKRYLINSIQNHMSKIINKTKILYDFKMDEKINFHERIDGHSNLVVIVQTVNNILFAGYYSGKYVEKLIMNEEGLLVSLTNYKYYVLNNRQNNPKKDIRDNKIMHGMIFDTFFLIFGNSEIRIRQGERKIYSNFGLNNSYFMSKGDKVNQLLGQGKTNEIQFNNYQIYEVFFDEQLEFCSLK